MTTLIGGLSSSKDEMTYLGFALIFVFLALVYRHIHAISPLIPIVLVVGWNSVAMYILGISVFPPDRDPRLHDHRGRCRIHDPRDGTL